MLKRSVILAFSLHVSSYVWALTPMTPPTTNPATTTGPTSTGSGPALSEAAKTAPKTTSSGKSALVQRVDPPKP